MSKHRVDAYGHKLLDVKDDKLERRINRLATKYATARDDVGQSARAMSLKTDVLTLSLSYFYVVGQGMGQQYGSSFDEVLEETLLWCLARLEPNKRPFTHFVRFKYPRMRYTEAKKEDRIQESFVELVEQSKYDKDADGDGEYIYEDETSGAVVEPEADPDALEGEGEGTPFARVDSAVAEFLTLVIGFLDHAPDKSHNLRAKLYMKMNFTEWATYAVKVQPQYGYCWAFEAQESRIFTSVEGGFLNVYMAGECESVRELWETELKEGYGEIIRLDDPRLQSKSPPAPWKLLTSVHLDYLAGMGIKVSSAVISQNRKKFNALKEQLSTRA